MHKHKLVLVQQKVVFYPKNLSDYETLCRLKVPVYKVSEDTLPLVRIRCAKTRTELAVEPFDAIEASVFETIRSTWEFGFTPTAKGFKLTVPNKKKPLDRAEKLLQAVKTFYKRHLIETELGIRRTKTNVVLTVTASLDLSANPIW